MVLLKYIKKIVTIPTKMQHNSLVKNKRKVN